MQLISDYYFLSFIATQTAFFLGFFVIKPVSIKKTMRTSVASSLHFSATAKYLYYISAFSWIFSQLIVYYVAGIPLLMDSRLETFTGGTGFGVFNRIILVTSTIALIVALYKLFFTKSKLLSRYFDYFVLFFAIVVAFLSGSKSALLGLIFMMFFVVFFSYKIFSGTYAKVMLKKVRKKQWQLFGLAVFAALFTIVVQVTLKYGDSNSINPLVHLAMRFVNTGDVYMNAYPNAFLEQMNSANPFAALFKDLLGMFRIVPWEDLPQHLGQQLYQTMYNTDLIAGPNARHNVFGLHYFGPVWSVYFSFVLGMLVSFLRNGLYRKITPTVMGMIVYILLASNALSLQSDPPYAISKYISVFTMFAFLWGIAYLLANVQKTKKVRGFHE